MFPFDPPENIRKPVFLMFSGESKGILGRKGLMLSAMNRICDSHCYIFCVFFNNDQKETEDIKERSDLSN